MKNKIIYMGVLCAVIILNSCGKSPLEPESQPGRRDYVWTADTLKIPFTYLEKIWGDSPDNVWAVGPGGGSSTTIWKYNGSKWATDNISRMISPLGVWGFGKNNVWACGNEGRIWNYNGTEWKQSIWFTKQNWDVGFQEIYGDNSNNIYANGYADSGNVRKGIILHWNGNIWKEISLPFLPTAFIRMRKELKIDGIYGLLGWGENAKGGDLLSLFQFNGQDINKIYEGDFAPSTQSEIAEIGGELIFVIGRRICRYVNGQFLTIVEINEPKFELRIIGRNVKDIFLSMKDGIAHYNGIDIQYVYRYKGTEQLRDFVLIGNEIFVLTNDFNNNSNIIIRGKLP